jgi:hypothetical protein
VGVGVVVDADQGDRGSDAVLGEQPVEVRQERLVVRAAVEVEDLDERRWIEFASAAGLAGTADSLGH